LITSLWRKVVLLGVKEVKVNFIIQHATKTQWGSRGVALLTLALDAGGWLMPHPGHFIPIVQKAGWAPGLVWTGAENLSCTGIERTCHGLKGAR
jgi:hypothetical protein